MPLDWVSALASCQMDSANAGTDCYPVLGYILAYYPSLLRKDKDVRQWLDYNNVLVLCKMIATSMKSTMDNGDCVFYLGEWEKFALDSSELYLSGSQTRALKAIQNENKSAGGGTRVWLILVSIGTGVIAIVGTTLLLRKWRLMRMSREIVEVGQKEPAMAPQEQEKEALLEGNQGPIKCHLYLCQIN